MRLAPSSVAEPSAAIPMKEERTHHIGPYGGLVKHMSSVPEGAQGRAPPAKGRRLRLPTKAAVAWLRLRAQE